MLNEEVLAVQAGLRVQAVIMAGLCYDAGLLWMSCGDDEWPTN